jgi:hypothetical protein
MDEISFPLFDAHMHYSLAYLAQELKFLDEQNIVGCVNLWGGTVNMGLLYTHFEEFLQTMRDLRRPTFVQAYWPDWTEMGWRADKFVPQLVQDMRRYHELGCRGLKVWKDLGMFILDEDYAPVTMDDVRLEPVWETAAELNWVVPIHQADPPRVWAKPGIRTGLSREEIFQRRDVVLARHPEIRWVLCHNCNDAGNVKAMAALLDRFPFVMTDINRYQEEADSLDDIRWFFEAYADRVMWGTDMINPVERPPDVPWTIENVYRPWRKRLAGYGLSPATFRKLTMENAQRLYMDRS